MGKLWLFSKIQYGGRPLFSNCTDVIYDYPRLLFGNIMCLWRFYSNKTLSFEDNDIFVFLLNGSGLPDYVPIFKGFQECYPLNVVGHRAIGIIT